ncbi:MAG: hypothetical protein ACRDYA_19825 [Egibacteraceae bacterium]
MIFTPASSPAKNRISSRHRKQRAPAETNKGTSDSTNTTLPVQHQHSAGEQGEKTVTALAVTAGRPTLHRTAHHLRRLHFRRSLSQRYRATMLRQPNERYRGSAEDRAFVSRYLQNLRRIELSSLVHVDNFVTLDELLAQGLHELIDQNLFTLISSTMERYLLGKSPLFARLPEDRFIIGVGAEANPE